MMVTVCLDAKEWRALCEIVEEGSLEDAPEQLLAAFVHDLTGFPGNGGSDERDLAHAWLVRRYGPPHIVNPFAPKLTFLADRTRTRRDHVKYLALIRSIALLHQHQRPIQEREGLRYIEATLADIEAANRLACEVLARSLDELPPQTRRLLLLIDAMIGERCKKHSMERDACFFTRRTVREYTGWGTRQIKLHLDRLQEMEYVGARSGGFGRAFEYELLVDVRERERATGVGLLDIEALKQNYDANLSGSKANLSGQNGNLSGTCRPAKTA